MNKLTKFLAAVFITAAVTWGQTWNIGPNSSNSVTATLSGGVLTISGTGPMMNFGAAGGNPPWYSVRNNITSVVINNGVTSIGYAAFVYCLSLKSVVIPNSVTSIGYAAFVSCSSLKSIVIPENVTSIEAYTFQDCSSLESVVIPNSVTSIGDGAFILCSSLKSVVIPNSVTEIGNNPFRDCSNLSRVDFLRRESITFESSVFGDTPSTLKIYGYPENTIVRDAAGSKFVPYQFTPLDKSIHSFPTVTYPYSQQTPLTVNITVTSNHPTISAPDLLIIELVGTDASAFTLNKTKIENTKDGDKVNFTVTPKEELAAGTTYTATATVKAEIDGEFLSENVSLSFTINKRTVSVNWEGSIMHTYDGTEKTITATSTDPLEAFRVTAINNKRTDHGTIVAEAKLVETNHGENVILQNTTRNLTINRRNVNVNWSDLSFTYDGTAKTPTAVSSEPEDYPITAVSGGSQINFGTHPVSVSLATPNDNINFTNATTNFTINRRNVNVLWSDLSFTYDGTAKTPTAVSSEPEDYPITPVSGGEQINAGTYPVSVSLITPNDNINFISATTNFTINRAQGHGSVTMEDWRLGQDPNDPVLFSETNGISGVNITYRSTDDSYQESSSKPANPGSYIVKAVFPQTQNYLGFTAEANFTISNTDAIPLEVVWSEPRVFTYNKMVQVPIPSIKEIPDMELIVLNGQSEVGQYVGAQAAMAMIIDEDERRFYTLRNNTVGFVITRKPLDVVMVDDEGEVVDEITFERRRSATRSSIRNADDINWDELRAQITANITYRGWAIDTLTNEEDNEDNSLSGNLAINIVGVDDYKESIKDGEYEVVVATNLITAKNYALDNLSLTAIVGDKITLLTENGVRPKPDPDPDPKGEPELDPEPDPEPKDDPKPEPEPDPKDPDPTSIRDVANGRQRVLKKTIVKDEMRVVLDGVTRVVVYDNLGNVVWDGDKPVWNLTNTAGRRVAEGAYLVVVELRGRDGTTVVYSAKLGVKR